MEDKEKDYFQREEERRMQEGLDAILKSTDPLNRNQKLTEEELESCYNITARRRKNKKYRIKEKVIGSVVLGAGMLITIGIVWFTLTSIGSLFKNNEKETVANVNQRIEILNTEISQLKEENENLSSKNLELQMELDQLKSQTNEQSPEESNQPSNQESQESQVSNEKVETSPQKTNYYTVQKGDTLWKISKKLYGTGQYYTNIMNYNNLKSENDLVEGMKLVIPKL